MVVSGDARLIARIRQLSNFGINLDANSSFPVGHLSFVGSNAKLSEYHAAVAHASLDQWDTQVRLRQGVYDPYRQALESVCADHLQWQAGVPVIAPTMLCVRMAEEARQRLERICQKRKIATRRWYQPLLHQHAAHILLVRQATPVAEAVASGLIGLPFSPFMASADIDRVVAAVRQAIDDTN